MGSCFRETHLPPIVVSCSERVLLLSLSGLPYFIGYRLIFFPLALLKYINDIKWIVRVNFDNLWQKYTLTEPEKSFLLPLKLSLETISSPPQPLGPGSPKFIFCHYYFAFSRISLNGRIDHVESLVCVWLVSLSLMLLRFIYVVICTSSFFLFIPEPYFILSIYPNLFIIC